MMSNDESLSNEQRKHYDKLHEHLPSFPFYIGEYIEDMLTYDTSPSTLYGYLNDFKMFLEWLIQEDLTDANTIKLIPLSSLERLPLKQAKSYFTHLKYKLGLSDAAINRHKSALRSLFKFLTERTEDEHNDFECYFYRNVMAKVPINKNKEDLSVRAERLQEFVLSEDEIKGFLHYVDVEYEKELDTNAKVTLFRRDKERNLAILALMLASGIRVSECVNLKLGHLRLNLEEILVKRKGGLLSTIFYRSFATPYLKRYLDIRKSHYQVSEHEDSLFVTRYGGEGIPIRVRTIQYMTEKFTHAYLKHLDAYSERHLSPHKFRHSFATDYAQHNDLYDVMRQLGHNSTNTSILYVNSDREKAKEAMRRVEAAHENQQNIQKKDTD